MEKQWQKLKTYLLATQAELLERNGRDGCKNCGTDFAELTQQFEQILSQALANRDREVREEII